MARIDGTLVPIANEHLTEAGLDAIMTIVSERTPKKREQFFAPATSTPHTWPTPSAGFA